ncbi:MAG: leucine-rich repeat protein [Clostridia bacterium]|nr:leucine-rich repeat protein [Clostridia bacterium]
MRTMSFRAILCVLCALMICFSLALAEESLGKITIVEQYFRNEYVERDSTLTVFTNDPRRMELYADGADAIEVEAVLTAPGGDEIEMEVSGSSNGHVFYLTIPDTAEIGQMYTLNVKAGREGYTGDGFTLQLDMAETARPQAPQVTWSATEAYPGDYIYGDVTAEGADLLEVLDSYSEHFASYAVENGHVRIAFRLVPWETDSVLLRARVGGYWSDNTAASFTLLGISEEAPEEWTPGFAREIIPGEDVVVRHPEVEGAVSYIVDVADAYGFPIWSFERREAGDFIIPAALFYDGGTFHISAGVSNGERNDWCWANEDYYDVPAWTPGESAPTVTLSSTDVDFGETITATISVSDAEQVIIEQWELMYEAYNLYAWTEVLTLESPGSQVSIPTGFTGEQKFRIGVKAGGRWLPWSEPFTVNARKPIGDLDSVSSIRIEKTDAGHEVVLKWDSVEHADTYTVQLRLMDGGEAACEFTVQENQCTVPAGALEPGDYQVQVLSRAAGYYSSEGVIHTFTLAAGAEPIYEVLVLPADVTEIGERAFMGVAAGKVIIPEGCRAIGSLAFADCRDLREAVLPSTLTDIAEDAFSGCENLTVIAPKGSVAADYASAHGFHVTEP